MPKYAKLSASLDSIIEIVEFDVLPPHKTGRVRPLVVDSQPAFNPATQRVTFSSYVIEPSQVRQTWQVVAPSQAELDAIANASERQAVKDLRTQIAADIDESQTDQAQAQAFIDLNGSATNTQRNDEVLNQAKRDKAAYQRYRRLARAIRELLRTA